MPYVVRKIGKGKRPYAIVNKQTGRIAGRSTSQSKALASARIRNRGH